MTCSRQGELTDAYAAFEIPREIRKKRIDEVLELVDLEKRADDLVRTYSEG